MNRNNKIEIQKSLIEEISENLEFKFELKNCLIRHNLKDWGIVTNKINKNNDECIKNNKGLIKSEYITCIGKITIFESKKDKSILVTKSDKIKDRSPALTDERQMQSHQ